MCGHLMDQRLRGDGLQPHPRAGPTPLRRGGRRLGRLPAPVAEGVDVVFTIVGFPADVREVFLGEGRVLESQREGACSST